MRWIPSPESVVEPGAASRRTLALVGAIVLLHIVLAWLARIPAISWGEDDVAYIFLARELRHFSYREIQDIAAPFHARFPPGYPALIALLGWPFGDAVDALLALNTLFTVITIVLLFLTVRRHLGDTTALVVTALFAVNPMSLWDSGHVMAEAPFKLFMMLGLWALSHEEDGVRYSVLAGGAMIMAALTRSAGIFLLPALFLYWVMRRRYRYAAVLVGASLLTVGAWLGWTIVAPEAEHRRLYTADLGLSGSRQSPFGMLLQMVKRLPARAERLGTVVFPFVLALPTIGGTRVDNAAWLIAIAASCLTGIVVLFRRWTGAALITVCYTSLLFVWRYAIERFANPLVPLVYTTIFVGADVGLRRLAPRARVPVLVTLVALLAFGALRLDAVRIASALECDRNNPVQSRGCWDRPTRAYLDAASWAASTTPRDAVFFVNKERGFYYHSGRRTINQDRTLEEDSLSLAAFLRARRARFAVASPIGVRSDEHNFLLATACRDFVVLKRFPEQTLVLRLRNEGEDGDRETACRLLAPYRSVSRRGE